MKKMSLILSIFLLFTSTVMKGADSTFLDYQNYNHGYCPDCSCLPCKCDNCNNCNSCNSCNGENECDGNCEDPCVAEPCEAPCDPCDPCGPCAPVCGTECGISICAIGVGLVAAAIAAAIIATAGDPGRHSHS